MKENKYTTDGKYKVYYGKTVIAESFVGNHGYEIKVLQGMNRMDTLQRIHKDCPEFLINNTWTINKVPKLFSK